MSMTSRERMLTALNNGRPDRMPCQVHGWMDYYLRTYLEGMDWWQAYEHFDMDFAIYISPEYQYDAADLSNWRTERRDLGVRDDGIQLTEEILHTPKGELRQLIGVNQYTEWSVEPLLKDQRDFEIWNAYFPVPTNLDFSAMRATRERLGDKGIIRCHPPKPGGNAWQSFCKLYGVETAILLAMDEPDFVDFALEAVNSKKIRVVNMWEGIPADMVETGGGTGSSTVISPRLYERLCIPHDQPLNAAYHAAGLKVVTHLCGGLMPLLELVSQTGTDGLETMTPVAMGGDCDLQEASRRVGDKLFFIGGFDQNRGFETGSPETAREQVFECFEATREHAGYICAPSDHFFYGDPANIRAFSEAVKECVY